MQVEGDRQKITGAKIRLSTDVDTRHWRLALCEAVKQFMHHERGVAWNPKGIAYLARDRIGPA